MQTGHALKQSQEDGTSCQCGVESETRKRGQRKEKWKHKKTLIGFADAHAGRLEGKVHGSESHNIMLGPGNPPSGCIGSGCIGSHRGCSLATFCKLWGQKMGSSLCGPTALYWQSWTSVLMCIQGDVLAKTSTLVWVQGNVLAKTNTLVWVQGNVLAKTSTLVWVQGNVLAKTSTLIWF